MSRAIRILVLGAGGSPGVNFIRALRLGKEKIYVVGVDINKYFLEIAPVDKKYLLSDRKDKDDYVKDLIKIIKKEKIDFVHAQPDGEVKTISDHRDMLGAKTFLPSKNAVDVFQDKWRTFQELTKNNLPAPLTRQIRDARNLKRILKDNREILWLRAQKGAGGKASLPVKTFDQANMWIKYWLNKGLSWDDFLISELLPGREVSWLSIWKDGKLICSQQKERMGWVQGSISPSGVGGTSAIQKTSSYKIVNDICTKTILAVDKNANGVYVVDVKENKTGTPCVMEVNPGRFFTTSLFFATAGVNMPLMFVKLGLNMPVVKTKQYNALQNGLYWIRVTDSNTGIVKGERWRSEVI